MNNTTSAWTARRERIAAWKAIGSPKTIHFGPGKNADKIGAQIDLYLAIKREGHTDLVIDHNNNEAIFRVCFTYKGGKAVGSRSIIYDLHARMNALVVATRELEKELAF